MRTICERSVQFDPKISGNWAERQGLTDVTDLKLMLGLSIVEVKGRRHRFSVAKLHQSPGLEIFRECSHILA